MASTKEKMQQARELIQQKRYDEARVILRTVDHDKAYEWLDKIDAIQGQQKPSPVTEKPKQQSGNSCLRTIIFLALGFVACLLALPYFPFEPIPPPTPRPETVARNLVRELVTDNIRAVRYQGVDAENLYLSWFVRHVTDEEVEADMLELACALRDANIEADTYSMTAWNTAEEWRAAVDITRAEFMALDCTGDLSSQVAYFEENE